MKKAALIYAMVMMISIIPAFALNQTNNNTTGAKVQDQTKTNTQTSSAQNQQKNHYCHKNSGNCGDKCGTGTCNGDQHKYQYGQKTGNNGANNCGVNQNCPKN
jgi:hypothetical protein